MKPKTPRLPWPRNSENEPIVALGIDVREKYMDIVRIVSKHFYMPDMSREELVQNVIVAILHKNRSPSAHDPRKSSFSHYVYFVGNNVCRNLAVKRRSEAKYILDYSLDTIAYVGNDEAQSWVSGIADDQAFPTELAIDMKTLLGIPLPHMLNRQAHGVSAAKIRKERKKLVELHP